MSGAYELFRALGRVTAGAEEEDGKFKILFDPENDDHQLIASALGDGMTLNENQTVRFGFTIGRDGFEVINEGGRRKKTRRSKKHRMTRRR